MHGAAAKEALLATPANMALCGAAAAFCGAAGRYPAPVRENASLAACRADTGTAQGGSRPPSQRETRPGPAAAGSHTVPLSGNTPAQSGGGAKARPR
jgi:hypothetical protein